MRNVLLIIAALVITQLSMGQSEMETGWTYGQESVMGNDLRIYSYQGFIDSDIAPDEFMGAYASYYLGNNWSFRTGLSVDQYTRTQAIVPTTLEYRISDKLTAFAGGIHRLEMATGQVGSSYNFTGTVGVRYNTTENSQLTARFLQGFEPASFSSETIGPQAPSIRAFDLGFSMQF